MENQTLQYPETKNFIAGKFVPQTNRTLNVVTPLSGGILSKVTLSDAAELDLAVQAAKAAFPAWSATPIKERVQVFYRYKTLLEKHVKELAQLVHEENGK
ncbi:MAG: aldehyde dehydrogenase family protein, partial [Saprospiraceae bacterium]